VDGIPEGFLPHFRKSAVTDPWEPLYSRRAAGRVEIGLRLASPHCNSRGLAHGGVIATLADNAMGLSFHEARVLAVGAAQAGSGGVTVNLSVDYLDAGRLGEWMQVTPRVLRAGGSTGFVDALITAGGRLVARSSAVFRLIPAVPPGTAPGRPPGA
jgi:uncharacterized protein (TIGR00369 family)